APRVYRDHPPAARVPTRVLALSRLARRNTGGQGGPLAEGLGFLERYRAIMRLRFGGRLVIAVDTPPDVMDALVPSLVLQPIVENAIEHGMADQPDVGHVSIRVTKDGPALQLEVSDDGPGLGAASSREGNGIGLANTRERLARLYGTAGRVETFSENGRGLTVRLTI